MVKLAPSTSLRPRSRPIKDQTKEMLRPKSRLDAQREKEERQLQMKTFGDLEYRADLDKQLSWNPIARLGYDPDAHKVFKQIEPKTGLAFQGGGPKTIRKLKELGYEGSEKAQQGSVITTANYSFSPVISHEFTHIGFDILKKRRNENPEAFDKKYGEDAGKILELTESGKLKEEYYIEFFDDLNTRFNTDMLPEDFKEFPKSTIRDTVQSYPSGPAVSIADRGEEKRNKRIAEIEKFQNIDLKRKEKGKKPLFFDGIDEGIFGLMDAAQDILTEQGEPPKTKMKTLSFWEKVGKSFSNLRPVGARGLYEGGLSAQTEKDGIYKQAALEFDPNIDFRKKPKDFNKGGTVMNRQMEMAFMKEGGLKDDGMKVDPVSGNEIPPGSMAKEVRDDIPAQLSEGEYVVPADVVQFYGVKHFEDLRNKAKGGLKQMENDGRIGGEPIYANTGTMVQGGFSGPSVAPAQPGVAQTPMTPQNPAPFNPMQTPLQGNPGAGFVYQTPGQQAYNQPTRYYGSFSNAPQSITQPPNTPVPVVGQPVTPPVDTPESCAARGMVFNPETGMCVLPDPVQTPQPTGGDDRDKSDVPQGDPNAWMEKYDYTDADTLRKQTLEAMQPKKGVSGFLGNLPEISVFGQLMNASNAAQIAANIRLLDSKGYETEDLKKELESFIKNKSISWMPDSWIDGDQLYEDILEVKSDNIFTSKPIIPTDTKEIEALEKSAPKGMEYNKDTGSYTREPGTLAPKESLRPKARPESKPEPAAPAPKDDKYGGERVKDTAFTRTFNPSAIGKLKSEVEKDNLASAIGVSRDQYDKMSAYERSERLAGNAKGGLMKRK